MNNFVYILTKIFSEYGLRSVRAYKTHQEALDVMVEEYENLKYDYENEYITYESSKWMAQAYDENNTGFDWNITKVDLPF